MIFKSKTLNRLTISEAEQLISLEESQHFDFKSIDSKGEVVQKIAVALNNADGGEFIIGIEDVDSKYTGLNRWIGKEKFEDFNPVIDVLAQITGLDYDWSFLTYEGQIKNFILYVKINLTKNFCKTSKKKVYYRNGAQSKEVTDLDEIRSLKYAKGCESYENVLQPTCKIEVLDNSVHLTNYINSLRITKKENIEFLEAENLINNEWIPNTACILLFSDNPCVFCPQAAIKVAIYDTSEEEEDREVRRSIEKFEAPLVELVSQVNDFINKSLNTLEVWTYKGKINPIYPKEAIWEILVNTVMHRDYSINDHIQIKIFNNRIEFLSPGKLPSHIRLNNILDKRFSRNPVLARHLSNGENKIALEFGEGLNATNEKMKKFGLKPAFFEQVDENFKVILFHATTDDFQKVVQTVLDKFQSFTNEQLRDITGMSQVKVTSELQSIKDKLKIFYDPHKKTWQSEL